MNDPISNEELLVKVKGGLSIVSNFNDNTLLTKTVAVKQYMLNAGITEQQIETELGIATITIGVTDLWDLNSGEIKFSPAFDILMGQLMIMSIDDTGGVQNV
jgi:hypothetical protein